MREPGPSLPTSGVTHVRVIAEYEDPQYQRPPICNAAGRLVFARASDKQRGGSTRYRKGLLICNASRPCVIACPGRKTASGPMRYHVAASQNRFGFMRYRLARSQNRVRVHVLPRGSVSIPCPGHVLPLGQVSIPRQSPCVTAWTGVEIEAGSMRYRSSRCRNRGRAHALSLVPVSKSRHVPRVTAWSRSHATRRVHALPQRGSA